MSKLKEGQQWSENDEKLLMVLRRDGHTYEIIGTVLGRSIESVRKKWNRTRWEDKPFYSSIDALRANIHEVAKAEIVEKTLLAQEMRSNKEQLQAEIIADALERSIKALPKTHPPVYRPKRDKEKYHESEDVGLIFSDMHIGHCHTLEETGGLSEYNFEIFLKRLDKLKDRISSIVSLHSHLYELPRLHIFSLGDIVAGMNAVGAWPSTFINMDIMDQFALGTDHIGKMIYYLLGMFKEIYFYGIIGNHGRMSIKNTEKPLANWDYMVHLSLQSQFASNPQVKFYIPKTWWQKTIIKGHKFLLVHGDDVQGATLPLNGLKNFVDKWSAVAGFIPNYTIAGHFHTMAELSTAQGKLMVNGSFIGPDIYSLKTLHAASPPEQKIFGIHEKRGITWKYDIDLRE